jgi:hypothetical protein
MVVSSLLFASGLAALAVIHLMNACGPSTVRTEKPTGNSTVPIAISELHENMSLFALRRCLRFVLSAVHGVGIH